MVFSEVFSIRKSDVVLAAYSWIAAAPDLPIHVSLYQEEHGGFKASLRSGETTYDDDADLRN
jgi:hypothetical protein